MAQHFGSQVGLSAIRIHDVALPIADRGVRQCFGHSHGIQGQVAPRQVFFQRHIGRGLNGKAFVTPCRFSLGARQCEFFTRLRVQKNRKVFAHRHIALRCHGFRGAAHHHPIAVVDGQSHEGIPHRATHHINTHADVHR